MIYLYASCEICDIEYMANLLTCFVCRYRYRVKWSEIVDSVMVIGRIRNGFGNYHYFDGGSY